MLLLLLLLCVCVSNSERHHTKMADRSRHTLSAGCDDQHSCDFCVSAKSSTLGVGCKWCTDEKKCKSKASGVCSGKREDTCAPVAERTPVQDYEAYCGGSAVTRPSFDYAQVNYSLVQQLNGDGCTIPGPSGCIANLATLNIQVIERKSGKRVNEYMPNLVGQGLKATYVSKLLATSVPRTTVAASFKALTVGYGVKYSSTDKAEVQEQVCEFMGTYNVNVNEMEKKTSEYKTMNEFFRRGLAPGQRPVDSTPYALLSPADCRLHVYPTLEDAQAVWVKGKPFTLSQLVNNNAEWTQTYQSGSLVIARLAPQDYHRYHLPLGGKVTKIVDISGEYFSVNPTAVLNEYISVFSQNKRSIVEIEVASSELPAGAPPLKYLFIAVGATNVASIKLHYSEGQSVKKGDEFGWFQFGGSTILLLFPKDVLQFDADLLDHSAGEPDPIETLVQVNTKIGIIKSKEQKPTPAKEQGPTPIDNTTRANVGSLTAYCTAWAGMLSLFVSCIH